MTYYGTKLSDNITETPEGFLICHDVIIARTGVQDYSPSEVPIEAKTSVVKIHREKSEVLRAETISSFEGKPVTANHPSDFVTPDNWNELAMGFVKNVRASEDGDDGYIVADLVITNSKAIQAVKDGLREVSCGYEADYVDLENGEGKQTNILGNHVALVSAGRCGNMCSIKDSAHTGEKQSQIGGIKMGMKEKLLEALSKVFDAEATKEDIEAVDEDVIVETKDDPMMEINSKLDLIIEALGKIAGVEEKEITADTDTIARAEILVPGIAKDGDVKAKAMDAFLATSEGESIAKSLNGLTGDSLFVAASELLKATRNAKMIKPIGDSMFVPSAVTAEDLNKQNAEYWAKK